MGPIRIDDRFESWKETVAGDGAVSVGADGVMTCSGTAAGSGRAYRWFAALGRGGDRLRFSVMARDRLNDGANHAVVLVDAPKGTLQSRMLVQSRDYQRHVVEYTVPLHVDAVQVAFLCGVITSYAGNAAYYQPKLEIESATLAPSRTIASGLLKIPGALEAPAWHSFPHRGFGTPTYDALAKEFTIPLNFAHDFQFTADHRPLVFATAADDANGSAGGALVWYPYQVGADGSFKLRARELLTGALHDFAADSADRYVFLKVET